MRIKNNLKNNFILSLLSLLLSITFLCDVYGADFSLKPSIALKGEYNDNIFLSKKDRVEDYIVYVMPSAKLAYKAPFWDWTMDYTLNWRYYTKRGENKTSHDLNLSSKVKAVENLLYIDISDTYSNVELDPRRPSSEANLLVNRSDTNTFMLSPYIKYQLTPASILSAGYRYRNIWYRNKDGIKRNMHTGFTELEYVFNPKVNAGFGIEYTADVAEGSARDTKQPSAYLKMKYIISPRTNFDGNISYKIINFDKGKNTNKFLYNALIAYKFADKGMISFRINSEITASPLNGVMQSKMEEISLKYGDMLSFDGRIYHRKDEYLEILLRNNAAGISVGVENKISPRFSLKASGRYEKSRFKPEDALKEIYGVSGGCSYQLTNMASLDFSYGHRKENAQKDINDYRENILSAQLKINF